MNPTKSNVKDYSYSDGHNAFISMIWDKQKQMLKCQTSQLNHYEQGNLIQGEGADSLKTVVDTKGKTA